MNRRRLLEIVIVAGAVVTLFVMLADATGFVEFLGRGGEASQLCIQTYGNGTEYIGWIDSQPPYIVCELENGTVKLVETTEQLVE